jgi:Arc/MetJ-type ribon-helix-helix transcriptional regulator
MDTTERTIRLTEQDRAAITAIREQYGLTSDSEAIRFALHTMWREIELQRNPHHSPNKERRSHPTP